MFEKILVPLDGSEHSASILDQVRRLLLVEDSKVQLLFVLPFVGDPVPEEAALRIEMEEHLTARRDALREEGAAVEFEILRGDPATEILAFAGELDPCLIAMSTHGRTGWGRVLRGSVAERVLRHARHPLLMLHPQGLGETKAVVDRFRRILVPLDGSDNSLSILDQVEIVARLYGSEVVLQHSSLETEWTPFETPKLPPEYLVDESTLEPHRQRLADAGIACRVRIDRHLPTQGIVRAIEEEAVDLVAMTTHGRTGLGRWLLGSVAEGVVRHCCVPILLVRTAGRTPE